MKAPAFLAPLLNGDAASCVLIDQRGHTIASRVHAAFDSASRKRGLLGRDGLDDREAILIAPCNAVHMFFMKFPIDVVHVDRDGRVLRVTSNLRPWRVDVCWRGFAVIEMNAGATERAGLRKGDSVAVQPAPGSVAR